MLVDFLSGSLLVFWTFIRIPTGKSARLDLLRRCAMKRRARDAAGTARPAKAVRITVEVAPAGGGGAGVIPVAVAEPTPPPLRAEPTPPLRGCVAVFLAAAKAGGPAGVVKPPGVSLVAVAEPTSPPLRAEPTPPLRGCVAVVQPVFLAAAKAGKPPEPLRAEALRHTVFLAAAKAGGPAGVVKPPEPELLPLRAAALRHPVFLAAAKAGGPAGVVATAVAPVPVAAPWHWPMGTRANRIGISMAGMAPRANRPAQCLICEMRIAPGSHRFQYWFATNKAPRYIHAECIVCLEPTAATADLNLLLENAAVATTDSLKAVVNGAIAVLQTV